MAPKTPTLTAKALQALLVRIGSASSGNKSSLFDRFKQDMARPNSLYRLAQMEGNTNTAQDQRDLRIVSIDMGIKNLAYCVANLRCSPSASKAYNQSSAAVDISAWKKIDLIERTREYRTHSSSPEIIEEETDPNEDLDPYSLAVLSHTAHHLVTQEVLSYKPDIILIEKQRWRSGGGSAIQQWTIRVNTLEAMLWAVLETLKSTHTNASRKSTNTTKDYEVFAIDPKRVGHYWLEQHARVVAEKTGSETESPIDEESPTPEKKLSRSKAEKKAKISLLRSWLALNPASSAPSTPDSYPALTFTFGPETESIRQALRAPLKSVGRKKSAKKSATGETQEDAVTTLQPEAVGDSELKKLDDVTDCFLQAAAWIAWELNRLQLLDVQDSEGREGKGAPAPLDEATVLKMSSHSK